MEPLTAITTALAAGASAAFRDTASTAIKDAYSALKKLIKARFTGATVDSLEAKPGSPARREAVKEELEEGGAHHDEEVLRLARLVLETVSSQAPEVAEKIGIDLSDIRAGALRITDVISSGVGVTVRGANVAGTIEITGVRAGAEEPPPKKA